LRFVIPPEPGLPSRLHQNQQGNNVYAPGPVLPQLKIKTLALLVALALPALARAQAAAETVLPAIQVSAERPDETTEGTTSYTTGRTRTALPLGTSLRDTPQSVSVVTRQRIEDQDMTDITDVLNSVTGVSVNQYETNRAQFTSRGFDINTLMIDSVPTTWAQAWSSGEAMSTLSIYDRVEVVRGATGLTTGAGDPSAAINLVRKRASAKEFTGKAELGVGRWNERRAMVDLSTPLNQAGSVRARVVGEHSDRDSWVDKLGNKSQTLFATFEADLGPSTLLSGGFSRQENKTRSPMWGGLPFWYSDGTRTDWDRSKTTAADWTRWNSTYDNYFAGLEHKLDNGWKLNATYNNGERDAESYLLFLDRFPDRATGLGMTAFPGNYFVNTRQEDIGLQATGPFEFLGRKHELAFGYVHSTQKFNADNRVAAFGLAPDFNTWDGSYAEPAWGPRSFFESSKTTQEAVYGAARLRVSDPLQVILGARVTNYKRSGLVAPSTPSSTKTSGEVTPYAGLIYDINENYSAYASYTDIFLPQQQQDVNRQTLEPIVGKSAEIGVKGEFFDGRLNATAAVFQIKQDNLAQANGTVPGTADIAYVSAEGATSQGIEFDLAGELAPGWNASFGITKFSAKDAQGVDVNRHYPRELVRVFTTYRLPGAWNALTVGGGVNWQGKTYTEAPNPAGVGERIEQKSFALVNLMARYQVNKQLTAQLNIDNLLDEKYFNLFDAYGQMTYGAPRGISLKATYTF